MIGDKKQNDQSHTQNAHNNIMPIIQLSPCKEKKADHKEQYSSRDQPVIPYESMTFIIALQDSVSFIYYSIS